MVQHEFGVLTRLTRVIVWPLGASEQKLIKTFDFLILWDSLGG